MGSFLSNIGGALNNVFATKEGGTNFGNALRGAASALTGGLLGQGTMLRRPGETKEQFQARLLAQGGAAVQAFNTPVPNTGDMTNWKKNIELGAVTQWLRSNWYLPAALLLGAGLLIFKAIRR